MIKYRYHYIYKCIIKFNYTKCLKRKKYLAACKRDLTTLIKIVRRKIEKNVVIELIEKKSEGFRNYYQELL